MIIGIFVLMGVIGSCSSGGEFILLLFIGVMAAGCWSELRGGCFWEVYNGLVLFKSIGDIWFVCSREVGCFLEGLLREVVKRGFTVILIRVFV